MVLWVLSVAQAADLSGLQPEALAQAICAESNRVRAEQGLPALPIEPMLSTGAQLHADQMVAHGFFDHDAPEGAPYRTPKDRMLEAGVGNPFAAENIASWYALQYEGGGYMVISERRTVLASQGHILQPHTPETFAAGIVAYWMDSPAHRDNLLSTEATGLGCGAALVFEGAFPMIKGVQLFQWYEPVQPASAD